VTFRSTWSSIRLIFGARIRFRIDGGWSNQGFSAATSCVRDLVVSAGTCRLPTIAGHLLLAFALAACASRPTDVLAPVADTVPSTARVEMLVDTTRKPSDVPGEMFTGERGPAPAFAEIVVSIPEKAKRKVGEVQWPKKLPPIPRRIS